MKPKQISSKLILNKETVINLNNAAMGGARAIAAAGTNFMTCDGEDKCDSDNTCNNPECQAAQAEAAIR